MTDGELAAQLASDAGKMLLALQKTGSGKAIGDEGDRMANGFLCASIRKARPDDALLSEEEIDCTSRCSVSRVWIVDPLDGTREYGEGRDDWAVHVALAIDGIAVAGAVALPALDLTLCSEKPHILRLANQPLKMVVSRTRPAAEAVALADKLGAELLPMGSAGAKAMAIVRGEADIYLHSGGQYEWDSCAPVAVALAYGLHVSRIDGSPLVYNQADVYMPDLLICRKEHAARVLAEVAAIAL